MKWFHTITPNQTLVKCVFCVLTTLSAVGLQVLGPKGGMPLPRNATNSVEEEVETATWSLLTC